MASTQGRIGPPRPAPPPGDLPHALTFFLSHARRRRVLAGLRRLHPDRARALEIALRAAARETRDTR